METETLNISESCWLDVNICEYLDRKDVYLNYIEYYLDSWYGSTQANIQIEKYQAEAIVNFLTKHFELYKHE